MSLWAFWLLWVKYKMDQLKLHLSSVSSRLHLTFTFSTLSSKETFLETGLFFSNTSIETQPRFVMKDRHLCGLSSTAGTCYNEQHFETS